MSRWDQWSIAPREGEELALLLRVGAPTVPAIHTGAVVDYKRPAGPGDKYAVTRRWCGIVLGAVHRGTTRAEFTWREKEALLRRLLAEPDLLAAFLSAMDLGGADAADPFLEALS